MDARQQLATAPVESSALKTRDGLILRGWHHRPPAPRGRVVLVHGYGEHQERYGHVVAALVAAGYECHTFDLRGHGASEGPRGHVAKFEAYRDDLARFTAHSLEMGEGPSILLAHSLGGLIALSAAIHDPLPFEAMALSSPFLAPAFAVPPLKKRALRLAAKFLPRLVIPSGLELEGLSRDPAVVEAYRQDSRIVRRVTLAWGAAVLAAQEEVLARAREAELPALFLLGGADPIADPQRGREVFEGLGSRDKQLRVYDGFRHEIFNEIGRERVLGDLLGWLDERFPSPASPPLPAG